MNPHVQHQHPHTGLETQRFLPHPREPRHSRQARDSCHVQARHGNTTAGTQTHLVWAGLFIPVRRTHVHLYRRLSLRTSHSRQLHPSLRPIPTHATPRTNPTAQYNHSRKQICTQLSHRKKCPAYTTLSQPNKPNDVLPALSSYGSRASLSQHSQRQNGNGLCMEMTSPPQHSVSALQGSPACSLIPVCISLTPCATAGSPPSHALSLMMFRHYFSRIKPMSLSA